MTQLKSLGLIKEAQINKSINKQFQFLSKLKDLGQNQILEDAAERTFWIVSPSGDKIRSICGHRTKSGTICFQSAGWGTEHKGFGFCSTHSKRPLYSIALSESQSYPVRLRELLECSEDIENSILDKLDPEIKILSALLNYVLTFEEESERTELTLDEIQVAQGIIKEIVKAKSLRAKLLREIQLDYKNVKEFINQIFNIIIEKLDGPLARVVMNDIYNSVIVPYQNKSKMDAGDAKMSARIKEVISKVGEDDF